MEKQERRLYFRAAMLLLVMMLTTVTTWADNYVTLTSTTKTWKNNTYETNGNVTIADRITVTGNVTLILTDGYTLTAPNGIEVGEGNSLTIEGGTNGTGKLTIEKNGISKAGIGGGSGTYGNITINGGIVNVKGGAYGAGIGGNNNSSIDGNGKITINGGIVNATGGTGAAGIGGGRGYDSAKGGCGDIVINGGQVTATGGDDAPGIGPGKGDKTSGSLVLGWTNATDFIKVTGVKSNLREVYGFSNRLESINFAVDKKFNISGGNEATIEDIKNLESVELIPKGSEQHQLSVATISGISASYDLTGSYLDIPFSVIDAEGHTLTLGTDYTATLGTTSQESTTIHITEGGKYTLSITGMGSYAGSKSVDFEVISIGFKKDANGDDYINMPKTGIYYDAKIPEGVSSFKVYDDGGAKAKYSNSYNGGLVLTAPANHVLQLTGTVKAEVSGNTLYDYLMVYDGGSTSAQKIGDKYGSDGSGEDIGTLISSGKQMTLTFHSDVSGQRDGLDLTATLKRDIRSCVIADIDDQPYTGSAIEPAVAITYEGSALVKDVDYEVTYSDNTIVGTATITITGKENYAKTTSKTFNIVKATPTVTAPAAVENLIYTGGSLNLVAAGTTDFGTLLYSTDGNNYSEDIPTATNAGTYTVYYKVEGSDNWNAVAAQTIEATIAPGLYTVSFDANGGSGDAMESMQLTYDGDWVLPACTYTAPDGKAFKNWNTAADGTGTTYDDKDWVRNLTDEPNGTVVLYAQWGKDIATCTATVPNPIYHNGFTHSYFYDGTWNDNHGGITVYDGNTLLTYYNYDSEKEDFVGDYRFSMLESLDGGNCEKLGEHCRVTLEGMGDYVGTLTADVVIVTEPANGKWGDLKWDFADGTMTISKKDGVEGDVEMAPMTSTGDDYNSWLSIGSGIFSIVFEEGVKTIAAEAFGYVGDGLHHYGNLATISLPNSLTEIGEKAFAYCDGLTVDLDDVKDITLGDNAFYQIGCLAGSLANMDDNTDVITLLDQAQRNNVTLSGRTLYKDGDWNTLCLPFDVTDFTNTPLEEATVMELKVLESSLDSDGKLTLNFNNALSIEAGKPYIVKWASGDNIVNPVFNGVNIINTAPTHVEFSIEESSDKCEYVGSYAPLEITDANRNSIVLLAAGNKLGYAKTDRTIANGKALGAFRAYFIIPENNGSQNAREFELNFGDEEIITGIIEVNTNLTNNTNKAEGIFDLQGRKVATPSKGIYIVNGKKVVF